MQVVIPWTTGTGNITLTYNTGEGNDTVVVTSDPNNLSQVRSQLVTFTAGALAQSVMVYQRGRATPVTERWHPVSYDESDHAYYSLSSVANGYTDSNSTNYATISLTRGKGATTYLYYEFDTSSIPEGATITSVECTVKCYISSTSSSYIATRQVQLFSGTTAKGSPTTVANNTTVHTMTTGSWTLEELRNIRLRVYGVRGNTNQNANYYFRFYGATLSVTYTIEGRDFNSDFNSDFK